jgi:hypothetical protein
MLAFSGISCWFYVNDYLSITNAAGTLYYTSAYALAGMAAGVLYVCKSNRTNIH